MGQQGTGILMYWQRAQHADGGPGCLGRLVRIGNPLAVPHPVLPYNLQEFILQSLPFKSVEPCACSPYELEEVKQVFVLVPPPFTPRRQLGIFLRLRKLKEITLGYEKTKPL